MNWKSILKDEKEDARLRELGYDVPERARRERKEPSPIDTKHGRYALVGRSLANNTIVAPTPNHYLVKHPDLGYLGKNFGNGILIHKNDMAELFNKAILRDVEPNPNSNFITDLLQEEEIPNIPTGPIDSFDDDGAGGIMYAAFKVIQPNAGVEEFLHMLDVYIDLIEPRVVSGDLIDLNLDPKLRRGSAKRKERLQQETKKKPIEKLPFEVQDLLDFNEKVLPELISVINDNTFITDNRILPKFTRRYKTYMTRDVEAKKLFPVLARIMKGESLAGKVNFDEELIKETEKEIKENLSQKIGDRELYSYLLEAHTEAFPLRGISSLLKRKKDDDKDQYVIEEKQRDVVVDLDNAIERANVRDTEKFKDQIIENIKEFGDVISDNLSGKQVYAIIFGEEDKPEISEKTIKVISDSLRHNRDTKLRNLGRQLEELGASKEKEE